MKYQLLEPVCCLRCTPDVRKAFMALPQQFTKGGRLAVDGRPRLLLNLLWPKYWIRPLTKRMPQGSLFRLVKVMVKYLLPISQALGRTPLVGRKLQYAIPVANYAGVFPLSGAQLREWVILDTFDMLSPAYDRHQSAQTLAAWFKQVGNPP